MVTLALAQRMLETFLVNVIKDQWRPWLFLYDRVVPGERTLSHRC